MARGRRPEVRQPGSAGKTPCIDQRAGISARRISCSYVMTGDGANSAIGFFTALGSASTAWPDEFWAGSIAWIDAVLRSYYGIYEFTDDPGCVLRAGFGRARAPVSLSDGTHIESGETIGTLHFWNEHLPRYSSKGPNLAWACAMRDRVMYSLRARLHGLGECFMQWGLTRAYNPAALPRQPFLRDRHELWISRATLRLRYGRRSSQHVTEALVQRGD